jgi:hypothetical protein
MFMAPDLSAARWFKSSASSVTGCVEVAHLPGALVALRDSKDPAQHACVFGRGAWAALIAGVKKGEFDLPPG